MSLEKTLTYGSVEHHDYQNLQYVSFLFALIYATFIFSRLVSLLKHKRRRREPGIYVMRFSSNLQVTVYSYQGNRTCFMSTSNNYDFHLNFEGNDYVIPAWSVSILPDCYTEVYNTAKVRSFDFDCEFAVFDTDKNCVLIVKTNL